MSFIRLRLPAVPNIRVLISSLFDLFDSRYKSIISNFVYLSNSVISDRLTEIREQIRYCHHVQWRI